jgi:hypothetical protein
MRQYPPIAPRWIAKKWNYLITNQHEVSENIRTATLYPMSDRGSKGSIFGVTHHSPNA